MAAFEWLNETSKSYTQASAWSTGVVPVAGDVAEIDGANGGTPTKSPYTGIISPASVSLYPYLCSTSTPLSTQTLHSTTEGKDITYFYLTPQETPVGAPGTAPTGETIDPTDLDLIGAGGEAALTLQNSTIAASTTTNVSGDAYMYAGYTNTAKGNIRIGEALSVNGKPVTSTATDANGFKNALYIDAQMWGSWSGPLTPNTYVPGFTSDGTISVAASSALWVSVAGYPEQITTKGTITLETAPSTSAFTNNGAIDVSAGGSLHVSAYGGLGELLNNGAIKLSGNASESTSARIQAVVEGKGTWNLAGAGPTSSSETYATYASFGNYVLGQTFKISGALLYVDGGIGDAKNNCAFSGGNVDFDGKSGELLISTAIDQTISSVFSDSITGFATGETIELDIGVLPGSSLTLVPSWNASTDTLTLKAGGTTEAIFKFNGSYNLADFHVSKPAYNGEQAIVTITTSVADAAVQPLLPADWTATQGLGLTDNMMHGTATGVSVFSALSTSDDMSGFGHLNLLAPEHESAGVHIHM